VSPGDAGVFDFLLCEIEGGISRLSFFGLALPVHPGQGAGWDW
jgi:hypothetical protein